MFLCSLHLSLANICQTHTQHTHSKPESESYQVKPVVCAATANLTFDLLLLVLFNEALPFINVEEGRKK